MSKSLTVPIFLAAILAAIGIVGFASAFTVHETQQALVLQFGDPRRAVTEPGLHFKLPFIQSVHYLDDRLLHYDVPEEEVIAADKKRLIVDAYTRYRIVNPLEFYQSVRTERIAEDRLGPIVNSAIRQVVANFSLQSILSPERAELTKFITQQADAGAESLGIDIIDIQLTRTDLPDANNEAIYKRMRAERDREAREIRARGAEEAQRIKADADRQVAVLLAEAGKQANIIRSKGDNRRFELYAESASKDPEFFSFYNTLKAYRTALTGDATTMVLSPQDSEFFRYFKDIDGGGAAQDQAAPSESGPDAPLGGAEKAS